MLCGLSEHVFKLTIRSKRKPIPFGQGRKNHESLSAQESKWTY